MINSPSLREQQLLTEFATFRTTPLPGVYLSLSPTTSSTSSTISGTASPGPSNPFISSTASTPTNSPWTWYGVIFLRQRKGTYTSIPLKFSITWPKNYPESPPWVVFYSCPIHPLVSRGAGAKSPAGSGPSMLKSYASLHPGTLNLRDGFPGWWEPKARASTTPGGGKMASGRSISEGVSPVEVVYYVRSVFTDKYLEALEKKIDDEPALKERLIVDEEAWRLWTADREALKRRVGASREDSDAVFGDWGGGDVPIRFLDLRREALDTIKENLGRKVGVDGDL